MKKNWKDDLLALLESHHARLDALEKALNAPAEKTFTRDEVRALMIWAAQDSSRSTGETFAQIADRVLREAGR